MLTKPPGLRVTQSCLAIGKFPIAMILMSMMYYVIPWFLDFKEKKRGLSEWVAIPNNDCHLLGVQILAIVQRWMDGWTDGCTAVHIWKCCGQQELVGGLKTILKNMKVNGKDGILYIMENKDVWNHQPGNQEATGMKTPKHLVRPTSGQGNSQDQEAMDFLQPRDPRET